MTRRRRCSKLAKIFVYGRDMHVNNSSSTTAHFTSSVFSRADYIRYTKQTLTIAPSSEYACLSRFFFFFFHFLLLHSKTFQPGIYVHRHAEVFFLIGNNTGNTSTFLTASRVSIALRVLVFFYRQWTFIRLNIRDKNQKTDNTTVKFISKMNKGRYAIFRIYV